MPDDELRDPSEAPWEPADRPAALPGGGARSTQSALDPELLIDAIPERMRAGKPASVEIEIPRSAIPLSDADPLRPWSPAGAGGSVKTAISVRLRPKAGGFFVEPISRETLWVDGRHGASGSDPLEDGALHWRFLVTPHRSGRADLVVTLLSQSIGPDGVAAEQTLAEQTAEVRIGTNWAEASRRIAMLAIAALAGGILARLSDGLIGAAFAAIVRLASG